LWLAIPRQPADTQPTEAFKPRLNWTDPPILAFIALYALGSLPLGFVLNEAALFLSGALHKTQSQIGQVLWLPPLGWETGYFFWGWAVDRFLKGGADMRGLRYVFFVLAVLGGAIALVPYLQSFALTMFLLFATMFIAAGFIIGSLAYANRVYENQHSGLIAGLGAGSWSLAVAIVMPMIGRLFDQHKYNTAFAAVAVGPLAGFVLWSALSSSRSNDR
jgi:ACS family hexuronate transporter-like MFS transporter